MTIESALLQKIHYFHEFNTEEMESIKKYIVLEKTAEKSEIILSEGDWSEYLYFLINGVVKVYKTSVDGKEQILHIALHGESLNDVSTIDGGLNAATMMAMTPVLLYGMRKIDLFNLLADHSKAALNAIKTLADRVRRDSTLVKDLSFTHVTGRLAKLILTYSEEADEWPRLTQQDMAAMVGTTREVVNRSLRTMEESGAIRLERHGITIINKESLEHMIQASS